MSEQFIVKLDKWTNPIKVTANSVPEAKRKATEQFPTCDCCAEATRVEGIWYLEAMIEVK